MDLDTLLIAAAGVGMSLIAMLPFYRRQRRLHAHSQRATATAVSYGLHQPTSLHPMVDLETCIGVGNCIAACPEQDVLGLQGGQAQPISPARCVGHGLCERACPVEAIQLVFGTATRGVDLPRIKENFETNVPGLYIVGELGGMGLIRNAFEQGRQCIDGIARLPRSRIPGVLDVVIVGCGPAGLASALHAKHHKLSLRVIDREDPGGTVRRYPRKKLVLSSPVKLPGYGVLAARQIAKEELIGLWERAIAKSGLEIGSREAAETVTRQPDGTFVVATARATYRARQVVLAIGRRGSPRRLDVAGENLDKVFYSLLEPEAFRGDRIVVVGGGDSAVEAALALADQPDNRVDILYRGERFSRLKPDNLERVERSIASKQLRVRWSTQVTEITPNALVVRNGAEAAQTIPNDYVFVMIGGELPTAFLKACGVEVDTKFGTPRATAGARAGRPTY